MSDQREYVNRLLESLGIGRQYRGHDVASEAICRVVKQSAGLLCLREQVLRPIARENHCEWQGLERNLRTVIRRAWQINAAGLQKIAAYPLTCAPTVTEFIDIMAEYVMKHERCVCACPGCPGRERCDRFR